MASSKGFSRGITQVLFRHLPEAIFEHDDYGLCKVTSVAQGEVDVNENALFDAIADALAMWANPRFIDKFPDPRDNAKRSRYVVGVPREVRFAPYPEIFSCSKCKRTARFADLIRRGAATTGKCSVCGGRMNRLRYVQAHNCGRLEQLFLPLQGCPKGHGPEHLAFFDPGRVKQARWYCSLCNSDIQALRMTPCKCAYNDALPPGRQPEKWLKVVPTGDPSLYAPHTVAFINFAEDPEGQLRASPDATRLMLARVWGLLGEPVVKVLRERAEMSRDGDSSSASALVEALRKIDPNHEEVRKWDAKRSRPPGQDYLDAVNSLVANQGGAPGGAPRRWLIEHTTLLDKTSLCSIEDVSSMLRRRQDDAGAKDILDAQAKARTLMGIQDVRIINDFPLALCAFGYTRTSRDPARTVLTPFPADDRGKIPLFAMSSETEALWFQLDPARAAAWLIDNGLASGPKPASSREAWAWLYVKVPGVQEAPHEPSHDEPAAVALRTLLHTLSHIFLRRIEWSGFAPSSVGEYLIPGSLSFILYANRYAETKIGGLTTLFEQRLNTWLWDALQAGRECIYDPICTDDGGSCAGCTHREHNCSQFNRELSRATVYGGPVPQTSELDGMCLSHGFWSEAWKGTPPA